MIITIVFILLLTGFVISFLLLFIHGIQLAVRRWKRTDKNQAVRRMKRNALFMAGFFIACAGLVGLSQLTATTPAIRDAHGKVLESSIAELRKVPLNGRNEWISIRGCDRDNPILLFLAGGPGGSQMAAVRHDLAALEKHFVVVNWDQPGSGKSYGAAGTDRITVDNYVEDGLALTEYLCEVFSEEKIYLIGESWGSALGIFMIDKAPERYYAMIGTGQMVSFLDTEIIDYELALQIAAQRGDTQTLETLRANGKPPYYGNDVTWKSAAYLQYLSAYMASNPNIQNGGYNTFRDLFSSEYGLWDKINYLRGIVTTFNAVYPQLYEVDLRRDYSAVEAPVYFFLGRHDVNAPTALVEDYYAALDAPHKEIIWFEHSGHSPWINESELFVQKVLQVTHAK